MNPNHYVIEQLARQKEAELQRKAKYAWLQPPAPRHVFSQRAWAWLTAGVLLSLGVLRLLV